MICDRSGKWPLPRPACGERSETKSPGEGTQPRELRLRNLRKQPSPQPSPREVRGRGRRNRKRHTSLPATTDFTFQTARRVRTRLGDLAAQAARVLLWTGPVESTGRPLGPACHYSALLTVPVSRAWCGRGRNKREARAGGGRCALRGNVATAPIPPADRNFVLYLD
jgi:hypothetical protein